MEKQELYRRKNVNGISLDDEKGECRVYVEKKEGEEKLSSDDIIPDYFDGYQTDVIEIGDISPIDPKEKRTRRFDTLQPGISIGHYEFTTAGSLGVFAEKDDQLFILTNSHVGAGNNRAERDDPILQPGPADGGRSVKDRIGELEHYFEFKNEMMWDASLIRHTKRSINLKPVGLRNIPQKVQNPQKGDTVVTTGRTAPHVSDSTLLDTGVDINVNFGDSGTLEVLKTNLYENFIQGGDSGSGIFTDNGKTLVDLVFAGSSQASFGIGNIEGLFNYYNIELATKDKVEEVSKYVEKYD